MDLAIGVYLQNPMENLTATGAELSDNLRFLTCAKLSVMTEEQINELVVDTIIDDEFHRTGAPMWGDGLKRLIQCRPKTRQSGFRRQISAIWTTGAILAWSGMRQIV